MSHTRAEEEYELFLSLLDQLQMMKNDLASARDAAEIDISRSKHYVELVLQRASYVVREGGYF